MDVTRRTPTEERYALEVTRRSLHGVAESLLAGHKWRTTGSIRLAVTPSGFSTGPLGPGAAELCVRGTDLLVRDGTGERVIPLQGRLGELAESAGIQFGAPEGVYPIGHAGASSDRVRIDASSTGTITRAFELGDDAMRTFGATHRPDDPPAPVLWPEHFDLGIALDEVNYGVSAGDDRIREPYAYVGPHQPRRGTFWEQPFGATRLVQDLDAASELVAFFEQGRTRARIDPVA